MFETSRWKTGLNTLQKCRIICVLDAVKSSAPGCVNNSLSWSLNHLKWSASCSGSRTVKLRWQSSISQPEFLIHYKNKSIILKPLMKISQVLFLASARFFFYFSTYESSSLALSASFLLLSHHMLKTRVSILPPCVLAGSWNLWMRESVPQAQLKMLFHRLCVSASPALSTRAVLAEILGLTPAIIQFPPCSDGAESRCSSCAHWLSESSILNGSKPN